MMADCLISLGSNVGDRAANLERAIALMEARPDISPPAVSSFHETAAVGGPADQGVFFNAAARFQTSLPPERLLETLLEIEDLMGRRRHRRWAARTLDLDLLLYDDQVQQASRLTLPHARMAFRRFVLEPAVEVAADMRHPTTDRTVAELLEHLNTAANYVAIAGDSYEIAAQIGQRAAERLNARLLRDPASSAGLDHDAAIECLRRRMELLDADHWPQDGAWTLSDFWSDEVLVRASRELPADDWKALQRRCDEAQNRTVQPKLLALVGADDWRRELRDRANRRHLPALELSADDPDWAVTEIVAAVKAMSL